MKPLLIRLPLLLTLALSGLLLAHGPIAQLAHYHEFADQSVLLHLPHAADILSNLGFAVVALWGWRRLQPMRAHAALRSGWHGYRLFLLALLLTALGSGFYHLAPDNARLLWDRLPIALACAGLLAAVRAENLGCADSRSAATVLGVVACLSVGWWYLSEHDGAGDLRPYLLLQGLPLILIPLWQAIYRAPPADRLAFGVALLLYVGAKAAELNDHALLAALGIISGHTLKHLLASAAAAVLVARLIQRVEQPAAALSQSAAAQRAP